MPVPKYRNDSEILALYYGVGRPTDPIADAMTDEDILAFMDSLDDG